MLKKILLILLAVLLLAGLLTAIGQSFDANKKLKDKETMVISTETEKKAKSGLKDMGAETTPGYGPLIKPNN